MLQEDIQLNGKTILITGIAGFIGSHLALQILREYSNIQIIGIDNMNDYYDVSLKEYRLGEVLNVAQALQQKVTFIKEDIGCKSIIEEIFANYQPNIVINLAAQAGVRYSIENPDAYIDSNVIGFYNILEACRHSYDDGGRGVEHLVYASSSSVYGNNAKTPYSVEDRTDYPVSLYAATKKSNELMAYAYSKLYKIPTTGLRFFTVYGPAGRPDMAYYSFANKWIQNEAIKIFNYGKCKRDFTYIDDVVNGIIRVAGFRPSEDKSGVACRVYNIGNNHPEDLLEFVYILQDELKRAGVLTEDFDCDEHMQLVDMQPGDVEITYADISDLEREFGYRPSTSLRDGLRNFAEWFKENHQLCINS